jgi:hypothetical protein
MVDNVGVDDGGMQMLGEMVVNQAMEFSSDPNFTRLKKYDKEAWRGEDQPSGEDEYFSKPIDLTI